MLHIATISLNHPHSERNSWVSRTGTLRFAFYVKYLFCVVYDNPIQFYYYDYCITYLLLQTFKSLKKFEQVY